MKKKCYTNPTCEVIAFADEELLAAVSNPDKKEIPIDNNGVIGSSDEIF